jgi:hypothetical protein
LKQQYLSESSEFNLFCSLNFLFNKIKRPDVCTDCILARITVINVIAGDYGTYVLRATSEQAAGYYSDGRVKLYQTPECQQSITNPGI